MNANQSLDCGKILDRVILHHTAPVITGLKPASLINFTESRQLYNQWLNFSLRRFRKLLVNLNLNQNICFYELHQIPGVQSLILFYDPDQLGTLLNNQENQQFMAAFDYEANPDSLKYLQFLSEKFTTAFPHEIGILLGIPIHDVTGFIKNSGKNYLFNKYWKVYDNLPKAKTIFTLYDRAKTEVLLRFTLHLKEEP